MITPGDVVALRGKVYVATLGSCPGECDMFDPKEQRCTGYCYRWKGAGGVVFRCVGNEYELDTERMGMVETPDLMTPKITELTRPKNYYVKKGVMR